MLNQNLVAVLVPLALMVVSTHAQDNQTTSTVDRTEDIDLLLPPPSGNLELYALPVGQGDCTFIQCPNGKLVVFDCGSSGGNGLSAAQIQAFLGTRIGDVVTIFISHPNQDHFNYLPDINWTSSVQYVIIGATLAAYNSPRSTQIYNWLLNYNSMGKLYTVNGGSSCIGTCTVSSGTNFCSNSNVNFNILATNVGSTANQKSIVMKITSGGFNVLLSGDMEGAASTTIAGTPAVQPLLLSVVYQMSHHGASSQANRVEWLERILPQKSFASSGYNFGRCRHPRCDTLNRITNLNNSRLVAATAHPIYCGNAGTTPPTQYPAFTSHIYETSPTMNTICMLMYTSTGLFNQDCYQVLQMASAQVSVDPEDVDDCEIQLDTEADVGAGAMGVAACYSIIMVAIFLLRLTSY